LISEGDLHAYFEDKYEIEAFKRFAKIFHDTIYIDGKKIKIKDRFVLCVYMLCNKNKKGEINGEDLKEFFIQLNKSKSKFKSQYFNVYLKENQKDGYIECDNNLVQLTAKGYKRVKELLANEEFPIKTFIIKAGQTYSGKRQVQELIINKLTGTIKLCDPYIATRTLDLFINVQQPIELKILTSNISDKDKFKRDIDDLVKEKGFKISIRTLQNIHDRYMIFGDDVISFGTSLKDLGNKDTIISYLPKDITKGLEELFDERFNKAAVFYEK
jgi:hypothetical protein